MDLLDIVWRAENGSTQRCSLISRGVKMIERHFLKIVLNFLHFTQDRVSFPFDFFLSKSTVLKNIRQKFHNWTDPMRDDQPLLTSTRFTLWQIFAKTFGIINSLFSRCVRIQMGTQVFHFEFQFSLTSLIRALNQRSIIVITIFFIVLTLKAICSRKWAVPLFFSVSNRLPASIQTPTVHVGNP